MADIFHTPTSFADLLHQATLGFSIVYLVGLGLFLAALTSGQEIRPDRLTIASSGALLFGLIMLLGWGLMVVTIFQWIAEPTRSYVLSPSLFGPAIAVGLTLFWIRGRLPLFYGLMEIVAAIGAIWVATHSPSAGLGPHVAAVLAAMYILVRGLDNVERGLPLQWSALWFRLFPKLPGSTQNPTDPAARTLTPPRAVTPPSPGVKTQPLVETPEQRATTKASLSERPSSEPE